MNTENEIVLLFDGECMLCNRFVIIPMKYGADNIFFVSIHSERGQALAKQLNISSIEDFETVYLLKSTSSETLSQSDAVIAILRRCGFWWRMVSNLVSVFPKSFRDYCYQKVAQNRSKLGKSTCVVPQDIDRSKVFL